MRHKQEDKYNDKIIFSGKKIEFYIENIIYGKGLNHYLWS